MIESQWDKELKMNTLKKGYSKNDVKQHAEKLSQRPDLQPYINNLDKLLGIKTINVCKSIGGIRFNTECKTFLCTDCKQNPYYTKELDLNSKTKKLYINDRDFDWYIIDKNKDKDLFEILGIKKNVKEEVVYSLGKVNNKVILENVTEEINKWAKQTASIF
jgi:hypothetical protein